MAFVGQAAAIGYYDVVLRLMGKAGEMKRFWRPAVAGSVTCAALAVMVMVNKAAGQTTEYKASHHVPAGYIFGWLAALGILVVSAVMTVRFGRKSWRDHQRSRGRLTPAEMEAGRLQATAAEAWQASRQLIADLRADRRPHALKVWGVVLHDGEEAYFDVPAHYGRFYGGDGSYTQVNGFFWGSAGFMMAGYAATALGNRSAREQARRNAMRCWRDIQATRVIATNQRLICQVFGDWMSFYYSGVTEFYPEPAAYRMVMAFHDASPLMISGPFTPLLTVLSASYIHGSQALEEHPAFTALAS